MVEVAVLEKYGAVQKRVGKGGTLFQEGDVPVFYYQVLEGEIRLINYNKKGKEMIQGIFSPGEGFGAPAIIGDFPVCSNAEATMTTRLICLPKDLFMQMLSENQDLSLLFLREISKRLQYRTMIAMEINCHEAEQRILHLLQHLKQEAGEEGEFKVPLSRQTIASIIGLRVETVIRAIKNLEEQDRLQIKDHKLYV